MSALFYIRWSNYYSDPAKFANIHADFRMLEDKASTGRQLTESEKARRRYCADTMDGL